MTFGQAAERGISRLRLTVWASPSYLELYLTTVSGSACYGPWATLHDPISQPLCGIDPRKGQKLATWECNGPDWEEYAGDPCTELDAESAVLLKERSGEIAR